MRTEKEIREKLAEINEELERLDTMLYDTEEISYDVYLKNMNMLNIHKYHLEWVLGIR